MRKLALKIREKIMTVPRKEVKRESRREAKAEKAAVLDKSIEKELLERVKKGVYGEDMYNSPIDKYNDILNKSELQLMSEDEERKRCVSENTFFIFNMLQAFEPPVYMSLDMDVCEHPHLDCKPDDKDLGRERIIDSCQAASPCERICCVSDQASCEEGNNVMCRSPKGLDNKKV